MKLLLHICCGVCAGSVAERLIAEGHEVTGFFYNPNIHPPEEYEKRLAAARRVAGELGFPIVDGPYKPDAWLKEASPLAAEPEGGARCGVCFRFRLAGTMAYLEKCGAEAFTTTLTVSPHKPASVVNRIGREIGGELFLERDFKKKAGFHRATELARQWGLYHQDYCGCVYSMRQKTTNSE